MKRKYDVVVIGCGPGGAMAGKFAALNGAKTLIVEEKRQIGFPVYDPMAILYSKSEMEEATGENIEPGAIYSRAGGIVYISPGGKEGKPQLFTDAIFVNRQLFEKSLAISAARAGAELMLHTRATGLVTEGGVVSGVIVKSSSGLATIPCSLVIAADGGYQHMARLAGIEFPGSTISLSMGCEFAGVKSLHGSHDIYDFYLGTPVKRGHGWAISYTRDRFTVGFGFGRDDIKHKQSLKQTFGDLIRHLEAIGRYDFSKASPVSMMSGSTRRLAVAPRLASDGIILVGDAAAGPVLGSHYGTTGMFRACWTGRVAGQLAATAVREGDVSEKSLGGEYKNIIDMSLKGQAPRILAALKTRKEIFALNSAEQNRAVEEIGLEIAQLHFYTMGRLDFWSCLEPVEKWLKERRRR